MLDFEECTDSVDALLDDNDSLAKLLKGVKPRMLSLFEEGEAFRLKEAECRYVSGRQYYFCLLSLVVCFV